MTANGPRKRTWTAHFDAPRPGKPRNHGPGVEGLLPRPTGVRPSSGAAASIRLKRSIIHECAACFFTFCARGRAHSGGFGEHALEMRTVRAPFDGRPIEGLPRIFQGVMVSQVYLLRKGPSLC